MLKKPNRWYRRRAVCRAVRNTRRVAHAICATLPVVLAPAMAQTAQPDNAGAFVTRLGEIAGDLYGAAQRDVLTPSRQIAADLLKEPLAIAAGEQLNIAASAIATTAQSFVIEPVVRQSTEVLTGPELRNWYQAVDAATHSAGDALRRAILTPGSETAEDELAVSA